VSSYVGYLISSAGGSVGGETASAGGISAVGNNYLVALPVPATNFTGSLSLSGAGTLAFAGTPKPQASLALSGAGSLALAASAARLTWPPIRRRGIRAFSRPVLSGLRWIARCVSPSPMARRLSRVRASNG
jgi:hypothetical protein